MSNIMNFRKINSRLWSGGQPNAEQIKWLHSAGVKVIINMAPYDPRYSIEDEPGLVSSLGMTYHHYPMDFNKPMVDEYQLMRAALRAHVDEHVFVHCAANYRVTVLLGRYGVDELCWAPEKSDALIASVWRLEDFPVWEKFASELSQLAGGLTALNSPYDIDAIIDAVELFLVKADGDLFDTQGRDHLRRQIARLIAASEPLQFLLPGFPCKSPNHIDKCFGTEPDFGEVMALRQLDSLAKAVTDQYAPGCRVTILSDGISFNDIVEVPDDVRQRYNKRLRSLCPSPSIAWQELQALLPNARSDGDVRAALERAGGATEPIYRSAVLANTHDKLCSYLYNDIRLCRRPDQSEDDYLSDVAERAARMMRRGMGLNTLIDRHFPDHIRLSVHQYDNAGPKFTFGFVPGATRVTQPWHAVPVLSLVGKLELIGHASVDKARHALVTLDEQPWLYLEVENEQCLGFQYRVLKYPGFGMEISGVGKDGLEYLPTQLLQILMSQFGFVCIRDVDFPQQSELTSYCAGFGQIYYWKFGAVHIVKPAEKPDGFVHSLEKTPLHWDLSMLPLDHEQVRENEWFAASHFMLYCKIPPQPGEGHTTVVDGRTVMEIAGPQAVKRWRSTYVTYNTPMTYFGGAPRTYPLVMPHPHTGEDIFRYQEGSESILQRFTASIGTLPTEDSEKIIASLNGLVYDPRCILAHEWQAGDLLIIDNWRTLHGRLPMSEQSRSRELWRVQVY
ncbi:L-tyrosine/L-tryptophan isonitrile synthase family protein [Pseudomonas solani]|uniref:L-tyrosine/L-tryptophan isonitrile synthase family protein n=1 Tax=Pseudomonas solani TaxID=2731552 RepID=UPI003D6ADAEF